MKNVIYLVVVMVCLGLIAYGIFQKNQPATEVAKEVSSSGQSAATAAAEKPAETKTATAAATTATTAVSDSASVISSEPISASTQHYRPDQTVAGSSSAAAVADDSDDFIITPEIIAKKHLIDKYKFGICYGQALTISDSAAKKLVSANPAFSDYLRQSYGLTTDLEVYDKIKHFQAITLKEQASSVYSFSFTDGQCETLIYYAGTVTVSGSTASDTVTTQQSHTQ